MEQLGKDITRAKAILDANGVIGIPTETVYGLAGNAFSPAAITQIFGIKNRPFFDPLIVHVGHAKHLEMCTPHISGQLQRCMEHFWPGPVTFLVNKSTQVPDLVTSGLPKVAVRMPNHSLTLALLQTLDYPLAAPSANPFGYISPTQAQHVLDQLGNMVPYVLDGGPCQVGVESTILEEMETGWKVLRLGGLTIEEVEEFLNQTVAIQDSSSRPAAPGMLDQHYSPRKPLWVGNVEEGVLLFAGKKVATLTLQHQVQGVPGITLSPSGNLNNAASNLFQAMRELDTWDVDVIVAEWMPDRELGRPMNDRLKRAAHRF